jgi:hypothetical protein
MTDPKSLEFWLKKRGKYPFITYMGGAMKAIVNITIPMDEIAEHFKVDKIQVGDRMYHRKDEDEAGS